MANPVLQFIHTISYNSYNSRFMNLQSIEFDCLKLKNHSPGSSYSEDLVNG